MYIPIYIYIYTHTCFFARGARFARSGGRASEFRGRKNAISTRRGGAPTGEVALSVCPWGGPLGDPPPTRNRLFMGPMYKAPQRGQILRSPRPKVTSVPSRLSTSMPREPVAYGAAAGGADAEVYMVVVMIMIMCNSNTSHNNTNNNNHTNTTTTTTTNNNNNNDTNNIITLIVIIIIIIIMIIAVRCRYKCVVMLSLLLYLCRRKGVMTCGSPYPDKTHLV